MPARPLPFPRTPRSPQAGRLLYCADHEYRTDFEDEVLRLYLDWQVEMEMFHREVMEEIREGRFLAKPRSAPRLDGANAEPAAPSLLGRHAFRDVRVPPGAPR